MGNVVRRVIYKVIDYLRVLLIDEIREMDDYFGQFPIASFKRS